MSPQPDIVVALLVRPGADAAPAARALREAGVTDLRVVALPAPGAWAAARNAALDAAGTAEVLAFVEDDVRVDPGWGEALGAAWDDERQAVAGGPLRSAGAPPWLLAGGHAEVLGLTGGPDPGPPLFSGGNVAFRVAALRGIGGFFPVRGHPDARDALGEDRRAQTELAAIGWRARRVDGMAGTRELAGVTPGLLLRRRARTGARHAALGRTGRRAAARLAVRSAGAAAVRAARGDHAGAIDRAAWAAAGLGGLAGGLLAHGGLQPDRTSTALRAAVPAPAAPAWRRLARRDRRPVHGAVLLYHRVAEGPDPLGLAVSPAHFAQQLAVLGRHWTPAPLADVLAGRAGAHAVAVTFDDGYHDNLEAALPALRAAAVPATLFASTGHIAAGEGYWWDEVTRLLGERGEGVLELALPGGLRAWAPVGAEGRAATRAHVHAALQTRDRAVIAAALASLRRWAGVGPAPSPPPEADRQLTVEELCVLAAAPGVTVQAHGRTHLSLAHAPEAVRDAELRGSADDLEAWLGTRPAVFSYPFGVPGVDVDAATRAAARAAGYAAATVNAPGLVRAGGDPYAVPRLAVPDVDGAAFARWLAAALPGRP
ncbi:polysaccharide deacetylase family protein [Baekduia soli]|uniref:Polysaccharide deacetylase family protein n=1 Tax=Baekduia soli TaxID=496014 RepID=A0A5B8TZR3_9ACTN|nr:polysaccharide deacetylase family protein [Baekduia soli]QEC46221.1 polysaccharide deacetylase family protein [Baekduia soli]